MGKKLLIVSANPLDQKKQLLVDEELQKIKNVFRTKLGSIFDFEFILAVQITDLYPVMLEFKPQFIHFAGEGQEDEGIVFNAGQGKSMIINAYSLADFFRLFSDHVECVLLNACYTDKHAKEISKYINYAVGMRGEIYDDAAIEFAVSFYTAIGAEKDIQFSFDLGKAILELNPQFGKKQSKIPRLFYKNGEEFIREEQKEYEINEQIELKQKDDINSEKYNIIIIFDFISKRIELRSFCFVLSYRLDNNQYSHGHLAGNTDVQKGQYLIEMAAKLGHLGELVFILSDYWINSLNGRNEILIYEKLYEQLEIYLNKLQNQGDESKAKDVKDLLNMIKSTNP